MHEQTPGLFNWSSLEAARVCATVLQCTALWAAFSLTLVGFLGDFAKQWTELSDSQPLRGYLASHEGNSTHNCRRRGTRVSAARGASAPRAAAASANQDVNALRQQLLQLAGDKIGTDLSPGQQQEVLAVLKRFEGLGRPDPEQMELTGTDWTIFFTNSSGAGAVGHIVAWHRRSHVTFDARFRLRCVGFRVRSWVLVCSLARSVGQSTALGRRHRATLMRAHTDNYPRTSHNVQRAGLRRRLSEIDSRAHVRSCELSCVPALCRPHQRQARPFGGQKPHDFPQGRRVHRPHLAPGRLPCPGLRCNVLAGRPRIWHSPDQDDP